MHFRTIAYGDMIKRTPDCFAAHKFSAMLFPVNYHLSNLIKKNLFLIKRKDIRASRNHAVLAIYGNDTVVLISNKQYSIKKY